MAKDQISKPRQAGARLASSTRGYRI